MARRSEEAPRRSGANVGIRDPQRFVAHEGYSVLVTRPDGRIGLDPEEGLYDTDTRLVSWWHLRIDGREPEYVSGARPDVRHWGAVLRSTLEGGRPEGPRLPQDALEIRVHRRLGPGMEERLELHNRSMAPTSFTLELELAADFADVSEAKKGERRHGGRTTRRWSGRPRQLTFEHRAEQGGHVFERAVRVTLSSPEGLPGIEMAPARPRAAAPSPAWRSESAGRLSLRLELPPRGTTTLMLVYESRVDGGWRSPLPLEHAADGEYLTARERERRAWLRQRPSFEAASELVEDVAQIAADDLWDLRNFDLAGDRPGSWVPNAGVPFYSGFFGRDSLLGGRLGLLFGPQALDGALRWVADTQGRRHDAWTEEQPGRMIHEIRRGPLSELRIIPQHRYYGAHTTSTLFPIALAEHWHWTGDLDHLRVRAPAALRALEWADRHGDRDGDGFVEYVGSSEEGLKNQGWKDSGEAIRYPDGKDVANPVAMVEEQAFRIAALERTAEVLLALDEPGHAEELLGRASQLRHQWHEAFWLPDEGTYALALDPAKRAVASIASNPGHALAVGVVPADHARAVAGRLLAPDLFNGWGVRTLSADHPSYNPFAYHLGAVWPFENAMFVSGLRRYGLDDEAERLLTGLFLAAGHFEQARLPELFGGHGRDELPFPTVYPDTNVPQAWTAAAIGLLIESMVGFTPVAPARTLALIRPRLPAWLPWLTLRNVRVGDARVSLRFERQSDGSTAHDVLDATRGLRVIRSDEIPAGSHPATPDAATGDGPLAEIWANDGVSPVGRALRVGLLGAGRGG